MQTIDIIIPIYQGYDETLACLNSAIASQQNNQAKLNIIAIYDCGPDEKLRQEVERLAEVTPFTLLINKENLGFVATVNLGMSQTNNDVVLLNSDAEVANNWADKLAYHANQPNVASVTPFSNNATICSYPVFCAINPLPPAETVASLDKLCALANHQESIDIPTAVGFCMYIPRAAINQLGLFDVEAFGKGYGEENDFCCRAKKAGMRNLFALDTFVMHEGGVSFADSQQSLQEKASTVLTGKHPEYNGWVSEHVLLDPAKIYRTKIDLLRYASSPLPNILFISHALGGGTQKHSVDLAQTLYGQANILTLAPNQEGLLNLSASVKSEVFSLNFKREQINPLIQCLSLLNINKIHYHHIIGLEQAIIDLPEKLQVPFDFTIHDYYMVCLNMHLNNSQGKYCQEPLKTQKDNYCHCNKNRTQVEQHWEAWGDFIKKAHRVFAPSYDTQQRFNLYYPKREIIVVPHPETKNTPRKINTNKLDPKQRVKILLIGALSSFKGADVLEECAKTAQKDKLALEFHLIGYTYQQLKTSHNLKVYGEYSDSELNQLISDVNPDLIWFPSLIPETYSYTLSSAMQSSYPIVSTNIGAIPERLAKYNRYWLLEPSTTTEQWLAFFTSYKDTEVTTQSIYKAYDWNYQSDYIDKNIIDKNTENLNPLLNFAQYNQPTPNIHFPSSIHELKIMTLKLLIKLKYSSLFAKTLNRIPINLQMRIKNLLLGQRK